MCGASTTLPFRVRSLPTWAKRQDAGFQPSLDTWNRHEAHTSTSAPECGRHPTPSRLALEPGFFVICISDPGGRPISWIVDHEPHICGDNRASAALLAVRACCRTGDTVAYWDTKFLTQGQGVRLLHDSESRR